MKRNSEAALALTRSLEKYISLGRLRFFSCNFFTISNTKEASSANPELRIVLFNLIIVFFFHLFSFQLSLVLD